MKTTKASRQSSQGRPSSTRTDRKRTDRTRTARARRPGQALDAGWTLPAEWYVDDAHHVREVAAIFGRTWQHVGPASRLAKTGSYVTAEVAGETLVVVRGQDAKIRAFHNVCRHRAGSVVLSDGCAAALKCTYHGWTYGLDGKLLACPEMETTRVFDRKEFGLVPVPLQEWNGLLFVNLDATAAGATPLARLVRPFEAVAKRFGLDEAVFARRDTYEIACNWKVYVDNFLEGYHIPRAHPGLFRAIDYRGYTVEPFGDTIIQTAPPRTAQRYSSTRLASAPSMRGARETASVYLWLFPGFMVNISSDYIQTNIILPAGTEKTITIFDYYLESGSRLRRATGIGRAAKQKLAKSIAWSDEIQQEDIRICENVQRNLSSRSYEAGRYCARRENGLHHFHELVRRALAS